MLDQATISDFKNYFSITIAKGNANLESAYKLRYKVFCREFHYIPVESCSNQQESDQLDDISFHCLVIHTATQKIAGYSRIVPAIEENVSIKLPIEHFVTSNINVQFANELVNQRNAICELSHVAVDDEFRKRIGEKLTRFGDLASQEMRTFPIIAFASILGGLAVAREGEKTQVISMLEPYLQRVLQRCGINLEIIGKDIDFHGIKSLCLFRTGSALENLTSQLNPLNEWVIQQIRVSL